MRIPLQDVSIPTGGVTHVHDDAGMIATCCGFERAGFSAMTRRRFVGVVAGAAGAAVLSRLWLPGLTHAAPMGGPRPIPGGISMPFAKGQFHVFLPEPGQEPSTITDFDGLIGLSVVRGGCTKTRAGGAPARLVFEADIRFMKGRYVGADGKEAVGTFGFV
jgi:hypothetical protein